MTNEEAIKHGREGLEVFGGEHHEFILMAISALEKQIPKRPNLEGDGYADGEMVYDTWICPNCGERYELDYDDYDFCPNCGQHLDWSDEDEYDE